MPRALDLCGACGRVACAQDLAKAQSTAYTPHAANDILLGTKLVTFSLQVRDPRTVTKYAAKWSEHEGQAGWVYDEAEHEEELFQHRFGARPTLSRIVSSVVCNTDDQHWSWPGFENQVILLDSQADYILMQELKHDDFKFGENTGGAHLFGGRRWVSGDIAASWDPATHQGVFRLRVYAKPGVAMQDSVGVTRFLGTWFGVLPFTLSDLSLNLLAKKDDARYPRTRIHVSGTNVSSKNLSEEDVETFNGAVEQRRKNLALEASSGSQLLGGTCVGGSSFDGTLKRFFEDIFAECIKEGVSYRGGGYKSLVCDTFLSPDDYNMALATRDDASKLHEQVTSLNTVLEHLENRGHAPAPHVGGLTVALLPFQSQSLQWAIERETTPGGIQSFFWTKLPQVAEPNTDLYFNPIIGKLSTSKPALVRGGIIASQMGLGKTVISLALILANPAPTAPVAGSHVSTITAQPNLAPGSPFRDPDLYQRTSSGKPKRGSIVSRGTLVVVSTFLAEWSSFQYRLGLLFLTLVQPLSSCP